MWWNILSLVNMNENDVFSFSERHRHTRKKKFRVLPKGVEPPTTFPITSSDSLPLSYKRLMGAKAIKLQSWPKISGQIPKLNTKYLPAPLPPGNVVKLPCLCTVRLISVAFNIAWGRGGGGGFQKFAMMAPPSLWRLAIDIQNTNVHCNRYFRICPRKYWPGL